MDKKSQPKYEVSPTIMFKNNIPQNRMKANKGDQNTHFLTKTAIAVWTDKAQLGWELLRSCPVLNGIKIGVPLDIKEGTGLH